MLDVTFLAMRDPDRRPTDGSPVRTGAHLTVTAGSTMASSVSMEGEVIVAPDCSFSMEGNKLVMVKNATQFMLRQMGGIGIRVSPWGGTVIDLGHARPYDIAAREAICQRINALSLQGGTLLYKLLEAVLNLPRDERRRLRTIILSDGQTQEPEKMRALLSALRAAGIQVDFLGTDDVDVDLARELTDATHGRLLYLSQLSSSELTAFLLDQAAEAANIVAANIRVRLRFQNGGQALSIQKVYPDAISLDRFSPWNSLGDLPREERLELFTELHFPAPDRDGTMTILEADIAFDMPQRGLWDQRITVPLQATLLANATPTAVPSVVTAFHQTQNARDLAAAAQAMDPQQALELLDSAIRRTQIIGDDRKTRQLQSMAADIRKTHNITDTARNTIMATSRRTKVAGS